MVMSCWVSLAKAWLSGAKTVMLPAVLRVPVRPAFCTSLARVVSSGLWRAAVATGSLAMPCVLPIPAAGIMPQSVPMAADDSVIDGDGEAAWWEGAGAAGAAAGAELPQAAAVTATTPATAPAARRPAGL